MRMNLSARGVPCRHFGLSDDRIVLTLRPTCPLPGEYSYTTSSDSLRRMLLRTDLPSTVIEKFESRIWSPKGADLPAIEISEKTLTEIGYFVD
jgi:hypothetical protein